MNTLIRVKAYRPSISDLSVQLLTVERYLAGNRKQRKQLTVRVRTQYPYSTHSTLGLKGSDFYEIHT